MGSMTENLEPSFFVPEYYTEPTGLVVGRLTFEATLTVVGVLGNILVCVVLARMRTKTAINRYLFNLGIADIGVLIVVFPMAVLQERAKTYFPLGRGVCLYVYPRGGGLPYESDGDARRKIRINTLKETTLGVTPALFNP